MQGDVNKKSGTARIPHAHTLTHTLSFSADQRIDDIKFWEKEVDDKLDGIKTETDALQAFQVRVWKPGVRAREGGVCVCGREGDMCACVEGSMRGREGGVHGCVGGRCAWEAGRCGCVGGTYACVGGGMRGREMCVRVWEGGVRAWEGGRCGCVGGRYAWEGDVCGREVCVRGGRYAWEGDMCACV